MSHKVLEDGSGGGITYAQAFMQIGQQLKVSPYFLASRIRQEQGVNGTSWLISGTYPGFEGYYNYFNISATGIGDQVIISGLTEAKNAGWTTRYAALYGGAQKTAENYILKGQDTFGIVQNFFHACLVMTGAVIGKLLKLKDRIFIDKVTGIKVLTASMSWETRI